MPKSDFRRLRMIADYNKAVGGGHSTDLPIVIAVLRAVALEIERAASEISEKRDANG